MYVVPRGLKRIEKKRKEREGGAGSSAIAQPQTSLKATPKPGCVQPHALAFACYFDFTERPMQNTVAEQMGCILSQAAEVRTKPHPVP